VSAGLCVVVCTATFCQIIAFSTFACVMERAYASSVWWLWCRRCTMRAQRGARRSGQWSSTW
jgi:hypothetical protein